MPKDNVKESKIKKNNGSFLSLSRMRENPWILTTLFLAVVLVVYFFMNGGSFTGNVVSESIAAEKLIGFAKAQGIELEDTTVTDRDSFYEISFLVDGSESAVYLTKDGEFIIQPITPLVARAADSSQSGQEVQQPPQTPSTLSYSADDLAKISSFIDCLVEREVKIYGANWCSWTKRFVVETLGGFDVAASIYVECTEEEELCNREGIQGFPTIKINGGVYDGERTFEELARATGCTAPIINAKVSTGSASAGASC